MVDVVELRLAAERDLRRDLQEPGRSGFDVRAHDDVVLGRRVSPKSGVRATVGGPIMRGQAPVSSSVLPSAQATP